jgi:hypothetical protein
MTALKHLTWSYEQEVRLVYAQKKEPPDPRDGPLSSVVSKWPNGKLINWTKPLERASGGGTVDYLEFSFGLLPGLVPGTRAFAQQSETWVAGT